MLASRGRLRSGIVLRVGILARASKIQKKFAAFGCNHRGDPYLFTAEGPFYLVSSVCPVRREGGVRS
jgi:hypothetical protein